MRTMLDFNGALAAEIYKGIALEREREIEKRQRLGRRRIRRTERRREVRLRTPRPKPSLIAWLF